MKETPEQKFERISRAVQESILRDYPNPERRGCPGDTVVRSVAGRTDLQTDELWEHITHCSPCYASFLAFKQEFRRVRTIRRSTAIGLIATAAAAIPIVLISVRNAQTGDHLLGDWNLEASAGTRGPTLQNSPSIEQMAIRGRGYIRVLLPLGSDEGEYKLEIRHTEDGPALRTSTGTARIANGHTTLSFDLDLSRLSPGSYYAAIGRGTRTWQLYPLLLR